jgi:hypothetical protein
VAAAGVCPDTAAMILSKSTLLDKNPAIAVHNPDRERAVKQALPVCRNFFCQPGKVVICINQNNGFSHSSPPFFCCR